MANKDWRPVDWIQLKKFICDPHSECNGCAIDCDTQESKFIEAGASAMLEARDKDWIAWIEQFIFVPSGAIIISRATWAERKQDLGL